MDDADGGGKSQLQRAARNRQCVLRILDAAADDGIDVDVEVGVFGEHLQFLVENFQALLRDLIRLHVVDGNLHVIESGAVQPRDAVRHQQIAVGDHAGDAAVVADAGDDLVELGMQQRLAAGDGDDAGSKPRQMVDAGSISASGTGLETSSNSLQ